MILPNVVESAECFGDAPDEPLFPEEESAIEHAVDARRRDYAAVRHCARAGLRRLGFPPVPIVTGAGGAPVWPPGVRGSMTHCAGYVAAAVGLTQRVSALGIDAEPDEPLPEGVLQVVATPAERERIAASSAERDGPYRDRLLFSAKEAVYKAWFPLVGEWLDPQDTEIRFEPDADTFTAVLSREGLGVGGRFPDRVEGRWTHGRGIIVTALALLGRDVGSERDR